MRRPCPSWPFQCFVDPAWQSPHLFLGWHPGALVLGQRRSWGFPAAGGDAAAGVTLVALSPLWAPPDSLLWTALGVQSGRSGRAHLPPPPGPCPTCRGAEHGAEECMRSGLRPVVPGRLLQVQARMWVKLKQGPDQVLALCGQGLNGSSPSSLHLPSYLPILCSLPTNNYHSFEGSARGPLPVTNGQTGTER